MKYFHVDVFSAKPLSGNGLTVVFPDKELSSQLMLAITQEFKQFETIFIFPSTEDGYPVRIFTVEEELSFAGHPILGAGAVIHQLFSADQSTTDIRLLLTGRTIHIKSTIMNSCFQVIMNQGTPHFLATVSTAHFPKIAAALNIDISAIHKKYPLEVVSTGLSYLLVPLEKSLDKAKIIMPDFESFLAQYGAKFVYVFNPESLECRTWDNAGAVEDVATGSAAGTLCAYLVKNGVKKPGELINLSQGKYVNRPSIIQGWVAEEESSPEVFIQGEVAFFSRGELAL